MALAAVPFLGKAVSNSRGCTLMRSTEHLDVIKEMVLALLGEVESLAEIQEPAPGSAVSRDGEGDFYEMVKEYEKFLIRRALLKARGNQARAARMLRLKPTTLNNKIKTYNLDADRKEAARSGVAVA